jgi:Fic family protein
VILGPSHRNVLILLIKGWRKFGRVLTANEIAEYLDVSRSTVASRLTWLSVNGYMSNDSGRRPLKDPEGNPIKMVVTFCEVEA